MVAVLLCTKLMWIVDDFFAEHIFRHQFLVHGAENVSFVLKNTRVIPALGFVNTAFFVIFSAFHNLLVLVLKNPLPYFSLFPFSLGCVGVHHVILSNIQ